MQKENFFQPAEVPRAAAFQTALTTLRRAKMRYGGIRAHRALGKLSISPHVLAQTLLIPVIVCGLLLWAQPYLIAFWRDCIMFWLSQLSIPFQTNAQSLANSNMYFNWLSIGSSSYMPSIELQLGMTLITIAVFIASFYMDDTKLPLKYLLRIFCVIQALSHLFFWFLPSQFPYSISDHIRDITRMGYVLILIAPVILAIGYYVLDISLPIKLAHTVLILAYFIIMIPHKVVLHTLILHHFSLLFMPILYICFGAIFDVLVLVALYSWMVSMLPANASP